MLLRIGQSFLGGSYGIASGVLHPIWKIDTVINVSPLRWPIERMFKSWKSDLPFTSITTTQDDATVGYLHGRMLLMLFSYAPGPQPRAALWLQQKRALSLLKCVRHCHA
jgi:hypothetical protein